MSGGKDRAHVKQQGQNKSVIGKQSKGCHPSPEVRTSSFLTPSPTPTLLCRIRIQAILSLVKQSWGNFRGDIRGTSPSLHPFLVAVPGHPLGPPFLSHSVHRISEMLTIPRPRRQFPRVCFSASREGNSLLSQSWLEPGAYKGPQRRKKSLATGEHRESGHETEKEPMLGLEGNQLHPRT